MRGHLRSKISKKVKFQTLIKYDDCYQKTSVFEKKVVIWVKVTRGRLRSRISNKNQISTFFKADKLYLRIKPMTHRLWARGWKGLGKPEIMVNLQPRAKWESKRSWSIYHLERNERLKGLGEPNTSSKARGWGVLVNLPPRAEREA